MTRNEKFCFAEKKHIDQIQTGSSKNVGMVNLPLNTLYPLITVQKITRITIWFNSLVDMMLS